MSTDDSIGEADLTGELSPDVSEADAIDQQRPATELASETDQIMRNRGGDPLDRISDPFDPVDPADAADQARSTGYGDDDELS